MKKIKTFPIAILFFFILGYTHAQKTEITYARTWPLSKLGIRPSENGYVGRSVQHIIDSAQRLTGITLIVFDEPGEYCFHDLPAREGFHNIIMKGNVQISLIDRPERPILSGYIQALYSCIEIYAPKSGAVWCIGCCKRYSKEI